MWRIILSFPLVLGLMCSCADDSAKTSEKKEAPSTQTKQNEDDQTMDHPVQGDPAPPFTGVDQHGDTVALDELLNDGPVVLIFYRGQWCPVCNRHLSKMQDSLALIRDAGATLVAVSPEKSAYVDQTIQKTGASYPIIYDKGYKIMDAYGVSFQPDPNVIKTYNKRLNANLDKAQWDDSNTLPVPATYVIGTDGTIDFVHFDKNYKVRASVRDILNQL